jgi:cyclopropane-fatty-acyl-phospholipid synthase
MVPDTEDTEMIMRVQPAKNQGCVTAGLSLFQALVEDFQPRDFDIRFWDGSIWHAAESSPAKFTLVLNHPEALQNMFSPPLDVALGESYAYGDYDIEGDFESAFRLADYLIDHEWKFADRVNIASRVARVRSKLRLKTDPLQASLHGRKHSESRDRLAVTHHYDLSNEFFVLWLDPRLIYSCAYFASPDQDLAGAQETKLDLICRKLKLQSGERFLDIGCGWGALVIHAVQNYRVKATGITLSEPQARLARERVRQAGLSEDDCEVLVLDYRELDAAASFYKVASVGMVEHVGGSQLAKYFERVFHLLKPGGAFLNHGIAGTHYGEASSKREFLRRYVFPDTEMLPLDVLLRHAEQAGFEIRHVESLREHYVLTLRAWRRNLENAATEARKLVSEETVRIWRLYLAASAYSFAKGNHSVFQVLLTKPQT